MHCNDPTVQEGFPVSRPSLHLIQPCQFLVSAWRRHQTPTSSRPISMLLQPIACYGVRFQKEGCPGLPGFWECRRRAVWEGQDWGSFRGCASALGQTAAGDPWASPCMAGKTPHYQAARSVLFHSSSPRQPRVLQVSAPPGTERAVQEQGRGTATQDGTGGHLLPCLWNWRAEFW